MLLAHIFGLPAEELLGPLTSGAFGATTALVFASVISLVRRRSS
jgi:hypothetical protein